MKLDDILSGNKPQKIIYDLAGYVTDPNLGGVSPKDLEQAPPLVSGVICLNAFDLTVANSGIWKWFVELYDDYPDVAGFFRQIEANKGVDYIKAAEALFPNGTVPKDDDERFDFCDEHGRKFHEVDKQFKGASEDAILKLRDYLIAHRSLFEKEVEEFWKVRKANKRKL